MCVMLGGASAEVSCKEGTRVAHQLALDTTFVVLRSTSWR